MLQRRGNTFTSRTLVPADLREAVGRAEITRSLRTGDRREADRRRALWETHLQSYFATVRRRGASMSPDQLDEIARRYLAASFDEIEARLALDWDEETHGSALDEHRWSLIDEGKRLSALLAHADRGEFLDLARAMLPDAEEETQRKLARRLIEAKLEATEAELDAFYGEPLRTPESLKRPASVPEAPRETPRVSEVARLYGDERMAEGQWSAKTELQNRTILALLADLLGDPQIGLVTKDDIRQLGHVIVKLPSNMGKKYPGMSPREILRATDGKDVPRLAPRSVNKYRQMTRSLFTWAAAHDYIAQSPAAILKDVKEGRARDDRHPFTDDDLRAYFRKLDESPERPELYWLPRILAYSGMRLGEAAQLTTRDLKQEGGVWIWDVNEEAEGKRLKTEASRRRVPVHPRLLELGILAFVEGRPEGHLIDAQWHTTDNPKRGAIDKLSKLLNRRLREAGITERRKTGAHSFRHTVASRLKAAGVPEYQIADLLGHETDSMSTGRYGASTDIGALDKALSWLQLPV